LNVVEAALTPVVEAFEALGIQYFVGGSVASSLYGQPRTTMDVDVVAAIEPAHVPSLVRLLADRYYITAESILDAIARSYSFNLIHLETMYKIDVFVLKSGDYDRMAFSRRRADRLIEEGRTFDFCSPEDIVLHKLTWYRDGGAVSERQWNDLLSVLRVTRPLDVSYMTHWAATLGVGELLERALAESAAD
jgi:hypothetical protein